MINFIEVTNALTETKMLIRTSLIFEVEEYNSISVRDVRKISFTDDRPCEYVKETMSYFSNFLCNS